MKQWILTGVVGMGLCSLLVAQGCATHGEHSGKDVEEDEVKVALTDCPAPVQATLKREVGSGSITDIDKETEHGKTIYEADAMIDGKNYEIKVNTDGSLIGKKLDDEKDEQK